MMDAENLGRVYHHLLKHRSVEIKPNGRRARPGEYDVAMILRSASIDELDQLVKFLSPQGFTLIEYNDDMRGVASGSRCWILVRSQQSPVDSFISTSRVYDEMKLRETDTKESAAVWFLHIWLLYLSIIYTRNGRGVAEVSGYLDATFSRETLDDAVNDHLAHIRKFGYTSAETEHRIVEILDAEQGKDVTRRITGFLKLMTQSGLIQEVSKGEFQQTLLGAHEFAENYNHSLRIVVDSVLEDLVNIVAPPLKEDL